MIAIVDKVLQVVSWSSSVVLVVAVARGAGRFKLENR